MKIKHLKEILSRLPDNMEVLLTGDMGNSELQVDEIRVEELDLVKYDELNGKPYIWYNWEYPENYSRNIIKSEKVLLLG